MQAGWTPITSAISSASPPPPPSGILMGVARQEQHADTIGSAHLTAMNRDVLNAVLRIARDEQRRSNIGSAIEFVVFGNRQLAKQIDMTMHHLLSWRFGNLDPWYRPAHRILKMRKQILDCHPERGLPPTFYRRRGSQPQESRGSPVPETTRARSFSSRLDKARDLIVQRKTIRATASRPSPRGGEARNASRGVVSLSGRNWARL